jgi:hypothetical protein
MPSLGISEQLRRSLLATIEQAVSAPGVDSDLARRATWLKWRLTGFDPTQLTAQLR